MILDALASSRLSIKSPIALYLLGLCVEKYFAQKNSWTTKVGAIEKLMGLGIMSLNESRAILGLEPVEGGDKRLQSLNYVDASKANKYQVDEDDNQVKKEDNEDEKQ